MGEMIMTFLEQFTVPLVAGICLCVGFVLKHLVPTDAINKYIPLIMAVLGVVLNMWIGGWSITPEILLGGMFSGLASTGLYEMFRNLIGTKK